MKGRLRKVKNSHLAIKQMKIQPKHELREAGGKKCQCQQLKQCGIVVELKTDEGKRMMHMDQVQECIGINT